MKVFHYRYPEYDADPWKDILIKGDTDLSDFHSNTILSINGQTILRQHSTTYITGRNTCHAHHLAKMLAGAVLKGSYDRFPGLSVNLKQGEQGTVLWVDSVHHVHACADFFQEMVTAFDPERKRFSMFPVDRLGSFRYDFYSILSGFEKAVKQKPTLIVIDDIDHLMPYCGVNVASAFNHVIRDILNHTQTACLFIGYNHLGKRASTTGNLGNMLFPESYNVFSVTTQRAISTVTLVKSVNLQGDSMAPFHFTIDHDNLPNQLIRTMDDTTSSTVMKQNTLRDIISEVMEPGQSISPDQLYQQLNNRRQQLNRHDRTRTLIAQAAQLGIIHKPDPTSNNYTLTPQDTESPKDADTPEGCDSSTSHAPASDSNETNSAGVNNSLTLPPHPPIEKEISSITSCHPTTPPKDLP